jgi:hypothetical protein
LFGDALKVRSSENGILNLCVVFAGLEADHGLVESENLLTDFVLGELDDVIQGVNLPYFFPFANLRNRLV